MTTVDNEGPCPACGSDGTEKFALDTIEGVLREGVENYRFRANRYTYPEMQAEHAIADALELIADTLAMDDAGKLRELEEFCGMKE